MARLLALETSSERCSVALWWEGALSERQVDLPREHNRQLLGLIEALMAEHDARFGELDAIAFGAGPGSFTGLRIACGVAQGLALGAEIGVLPVSSLAALAHAAALRHPQQRVLTAVDARMGEIYWCGYQLQAQRPQPLLRTTPRASSRPRSCRCATRTDCGSAGAGVTRRRARRAKQ